MAQLVSLVVEEPSSEMSETERYRRSNIACEVLTTDIPKLNEKLSESSLLSLLYSFLESDPPLNPLLASFFSRTMSVLICRNVDQVATQFELILNFQDCTSGISLSHTSGDPGVVK